MNLNYIDIHSHLNLSPLYENREAVLAKMREMGVGTITVGTDLVTSQMATEIAEQNQGLCWATVGLHPTDAASVALSDSEWAKLEEMARHERVVAIGETGLDYFRDQSAETKMKQTEIFKKHINLAIRVGKPLMLHVRSSKGSDDAYYDALEILKDYQVKANFHFFSGSTQCVLDIVAAGFTVSVDGPITFSHNPAKDGASYDDMIRACPLENIMIETDAPFAAPVPYRGSASWRTCEPWMVIEVAKKIAELKGLDLEIVRTQMLENTKKFFSLYE